MKRVPVLAAIVLLVPTLVGAQSLAAAARREAQRRATGSAPAKVYTDTDLRPTADAVAVEETLPQESPAPARIERSPTVAAGRRGEAPTDDDPVRAELNREEEARRHWESTWKARLGEARSRLRAAQREHDVACVNGGLVLSGG